MSNPRDMSSLQSVQSDQPAQAGAAQPAHSEWRDWLRTHGPKLLLFARQQTRSHEDAEDVLQDAQLKLLQQERAPDNTEAWLFRAVTNLSIDRLRALKRQTKKAFWSTATWGRPRSKNSAPWMTKASI